MAGAATATAQIEVTVILLAAETTTTSFGEGGKVYGYKIPVFFAFRKLDRVAVFVQEVY